MEMLKQMYLVPVLEYTCYDCFRDIGLKVRSFVKYLLWHQNKFVMDYPPFLDLPPPIMPYPPINIEIFATPIIQYFEDSIPPAFVTGGSN